MSSYKLSRELHGHSSDVKALSCSETQLISASRDATVRLWSRSSTTDEPTVLASGHEGFINAVLYAVIDRVECIVSGGNDGLIQVWSSEQSEPIHTLVGHLKNVCCLAVNASTSALVSGSWDLSVRVWENWRQVAELEGHEQAVWDVLALDSGIVTGQYSVCMLSCRFLPFFAISLRGQSHPFLQLIRIFESAH